MEDFQLAIGFFFINLYRNLRVAVGLPASVQEEIYRQLASSTPRLGQLAESIDIQALEAFLQAGVVSLDEVRARLNVTGMSYKPVPPTPDLNLDQAVKVLGLPQPEYEDMLIPYPDETVFLVPAPRAETEK